MTTCPKCGYVRQASDPAPDYECPKCGVVYSKVVGTVAARRASPEARKGRRIVLLGLAALIVFGSGYWWYQKREHEKRIDAEVRKVTAQVLGVLNGTGKTVGDAIKQSDEAAEEILKARKQWFERADDEKDAGIVFRRKYADLSEGFLRKYRMLYTRYLAKRTAMASLSKRIDLYRAAPDILSVPTADEVEREAKEYDEAREDVAQSAAQVIAVVAELKPTYVSSSSVLTLESFQQALSNHDIVLK